MIAAVRKATAAVHSASTHREMKRAVTSMNAARIEEERRRLKGARLQREIAGIRRRGATVLKLYNRLCDVIPGFAAKWPALWWSKGSPRRAKRPLTRRRATA
jgi:hypothetical protein